MVPRNIRRSIMVFISRLGGSLADPTSLGGAHHFGVHEWCDRTATRGGAVANVRDPAQPPRCREERRAAPAIAQVLLDVSSEHEREYRIASGPVDEIPNQPPGARIERTVVTP